MKYVTVLFIILLFAGCGGQKVKPTVNSSLQVSKLPEYEGWDETVFFSDSGKTRAVLYYDRLRKYDQPQETLLDTIKVKFFNEQGKQTSVLTALKGKVNDITDDLYAIDSVVAVNDSGVTLRTQELMWRNKDKKIISDKFVTITSPKEKIQGYGFESDQDLNNYVIYNITYVTRLDTTKQRKSLKRNTEKKK